MSPARRMLFWFLMLLGLGAVAALVLSFKPGDTWGLIRQAGPAGFLLFLANYVAVGVIQTAGWGILLRSAGHSVPFRWLLAAMAMGFVGNFLTPSMYVGGEPIRAYFIGHRFGIPKRRVMGTIVLHKFLEFAGFLVAMVVCSAVALTCFELPLGVKITLGMADIILAVLFVALTVSFYRNTQVTVRVFGFLAGLGLGRTFFTRLRDKARDMEQLIHETVTLRGRTTLLSLLLTGGTQGLVFLKAPLYLWALPGVAPVSPAGMALIYVLTQIVLVFQFTPGGLGLFEGGEVAIFGQLGLAPPLAMGYAAFTRGADFLVVAAGTALIVHYGLFGLLRRLLESGGNASPPEPGAADPGTPPQAPPAGSQGATS